MRSKMTTQQKIKLAPYQVVGLVAVMLWGFYFVGYWRSQSFGLPTLWRDILGDLLVCVMFVLPLAAIFLLGLPRKTFVAGLLAVLTTSIVFAECYACLQEMLVIRKFGWNPGAEVVMNRWPPYSNSQIFYAPGYGWFGRD